MNLPIPDMSGWTMLDFELAFDGVRNVNESTLWLRNQPRASAERSNVYYGGAAFIVDLGERWCGSVMTSVIDALEARRFPDAQDEDRRLRLLLHYYTQWGPAGYPLPELLAMLERWRAPIAA